jgi:endonuclease/exonuclease/phosphatase family metal-dependent hydrolase
MTIRIQPAARRGAASMLRWWTAVCLTAYPLALAGVIAALRFVGERWWVTLTALYLPRIAFALPLPFILLAGYFWGSRRLMLLQTVSVVLLLFPLAGLNPGLGRLRPATAGPVLRVMSFNIAFGSQGVAAALSQAREFGADIVLLQDAQVAAEPRRRAMFAGWHVSSDGEFFLATRFEIRASHVPADLTYPQGTGGAHYVQHTLATPAGLVDVLNVHPTSPRAGLEEVRGNGLRDEILSGRLFTGKASKPAEWNAFRRRRQVAGIAERAQASRNAVIVAGDTNLPDLSWMLGEYLGGHRDAFRQAGFGFGYTFPAKRPWLRIDRILTNDRLRAIEFRVGGVTSSDHRAVFAVLAADSPAP